MKRIVFATLFVATELGQAGAQDAAAGEKVFRTRSTRCGPSSRSEFRSIDGTFCRLWAGDFT